MDATLNPKIKTIMGIASESGFPVSPETAILDLGCGKGHLVRELRRQGYKARGCDFSPSGSLVDQGIIRRIQAHPYGLPFDDQSFDFIFSTQVFEHVMDYPATLQELDRVLRPGGVSLHLFPSRYRLLEGHIKVPFGGCLNMRSWLWIWAALGIRGPRQTGMRLSEVVDRNAEFLASKTNYLSKKELRHQFSATFPDVRIVENLFLERADAKPSVRRISRFLPFSAEIYSAFRARVVLAGK